MNKKFMVILAIIFFLLALGVKFKYTDTEARQFCFLLLAYGLVVYGSIFFKGENYIKSISLITLALCSVFIIIMQTNQEVPFTGKDYLTYMAFSIGFANILTLLKQFFGGGEPITHLP